MTIFPIFHYFEWFYVKWIARIKMIGLEQDLIVLNWIKTIFCRYAHGNFREIAAFGEIDTTKLIKNEAIWPWFEGWKVKDQDELWSWKFRRPLIANLTCNGFHGLDVLKKISILYVCLWIQKSATYQMFSRKIFHLSSQMMFLQTPKFHNYHYCIQFQEFLPCRSFLV